MVTRESIVVLRVDLFNFSVGLSEHLLALFVLFFGGVGLSVLGHVLLKLEVDVGSVCQ